MKQKLQEINKFLDASNISTIFIETENFDSLNDSK